MTWTWRKRTAYALATTATLRKHPLLRAELGLKAFIESPVLHQDPYLKHTLSQTAFHITPLFIDLTSLS